jgi:hypothetical protein
MDDMLNKYLCSAVQFHNAKSKETINVGVILQSDKELAVYIPLGHKSIKKYLRTYSSDALDYVLEIFINSLRMSKSVSQQKITRTLSVTEPSPCVNYKEISGAIEELSSVYITLDDEPCISEEVILIPR